MTHNRECWWCPSCNFPHIPWNKWPMPEKVTCCRNMLWCGCMAEPGWLLTILRITANQMPQSCVSIAAASLFRHFAHPSLLFPLQRHWSTCPGNTALALAHLLCVGNPTPAFLPPAIFYSKLLPISHSGYLPESLCLVLSSIWRHSIDWRGVLFVYGLPFCFEP